MQSENGFYTLKDFNHILKNQFEYTRLKEKLSIAEFSSRLGIGKARYYKLTEGNCNFQLMDLVNYCQVYGYDISGLVAETVLNSSDTVLREIAVYMASLSDDTLNLVKDAIQTSAESEQRKKRGELLIDKLIESGSKPMPFFKKYQNTEN